MVRNAGGKGEKMAASSHRLIFRGMLDKGKQWSCRILKMRRNAADQASVWTVPGKQDMERSGRRESHDHVRMRPSAPPLYNTASTT